jgi:hypothetical protein
VAKPAGCQLRPLRSAYQPPASSTFLSEQISHQQPVSSTFLFEQISTSHQPPAKRTGCGLGRCAPPPLPSTPTRRSNVRARSYNPFIWLISHQSVVFFLSKQISQQYFSLKINQHHSAAKRRGP